MTDKTTVTPAFEGYPIEPEPPLRASLRSHAAAISRHWFEVSHRTIEAWPIGIEVINGRRQPLTDVVWACALALIENNDAVEDALVRVPAPFSIRLRHLRPQAQAKMADWRGRRRDKSAA